MGLPDNPASRCMRRASQSVCCLCALRLVAEWLTLPTSDLQPREGQSRATSPAASRLRQRRAAHAHGTRPMPPASRGLPGRGALSRGEHTPSDTATSVVRPHRAVASPHWVCMEAAVASPQLLPLGRRKSSPMLTQWGDATARRNGASRFSVSAPSATLRPLTQTRAAARPL